MKHLHGGHEFGRLSITSNQECINRKKELFFLHPSYKNWKKWKNYFEKCTFFLRYAVQKWIFGVPCKFFILPILVEKTIKNTQKNVYFLSYFSIEFNILSRKNRHGLMGHPLIEEMRCINCEKLSSLRFFIWIVMFVSDIGSKTQVCFVFFRS